MKTSEIPSDLSPTYTTGVTSGIIIGCVGYTSAARLVGTVRRVFLSMRGDLFHPSILPSNWPSVRLLSMAFFVPSDWQIRYSINIKPSYTPGIVVGSHWPMLSCCHPFAVFALWTKSLGEYRQFLLMLEFRVEWYSYHGLHPSGGRYRYSRCCFISQSTTRVFIHRPRGF